MLLHWDLRVLGASKSTSGKFSHAASRIKSFKAVNLCNYLCRASARDRAIPARCDLVGDRCGDATNIYFANISVNLSDDLCLCRDQSTTSEKFANRDLQILCS
jgi:hypothetical protein